jgi:hypothetical protein
MMKASPYNMINMKSRILKSNKEPRMVSKNGNVPSLNELWSKIFSIPPFPFIVMPKQVKIKLPSAELPRTRDVGGSIQSVQSSDLNLASPPLVHAGSSALGIHSLLERVHLDRNKRDATFETAELHRVEKEQEKLKEYDDGNKEQYVMGFRVRGRTKRPKRMFVVEPGTHSDENLAEETGRLHRVVQSDKEAE